MFSFQNESHLGSKRKMSHCHNLHWLVGMFLNKTGEINMRCPKKNGIIQSNTFAWINCSFTDIGSSWLGFLGRNCLCLSDLENLCHQNFQIISIEKKNLEKKKKKNRKHNSLKHIKFLHYWPECFIRSRTCWMQQLLPNCVCTIIPQWLKQV